jgi:hypothetical protein
MVSYFLFSHDHNLIFTDLTGDSAAVRLARSSKPCPPNRLSLPLRCQKILPSVLRRAPRVLLSDRPVRGESARRQDLLCPPFPPHELEGFPYPEWWRQTFTPPYFPQNRATCPQGGGWEIKNARGSHYWQSFLTSCVTWSTYHRSRTALLMLPSMPGTCVRCWELMTCLRTHLWHWELGWGWFDQRPQRSSGLTPSRTN